VVERFRLHDAAGPAEPSAFLEAARQERKSARLIGRCFLREGDSVFHSYSAYARGLETVGGSYYLLDETGYTPLKNPRRSGDLVVRGEGGHVVRYFRCLYHRSMLILSYHCSAGRLEDRHSTVVRLRKCTATGIGGS
jgi:hypothetical protein